MSPTSMDDRRNAPVVEFHDLSLSYGRTIGIERLTLALPPRKLIGLIGPDGVGKSTLLSLITGAHAMQKGELHVLGGDMRSAEHRSRICPKIAYMPQGLGKNLYFTLTVEENLQFFARLFGQDVQERRRRIDRLTRGSAAPSSTTRICWCWMNPPPAWTRWPGASSGISSTTSRRSSLI